MNICPVCDQQSWEFWSKNVWRWPVSSDEFRLAVCRSCETIFCAPRPPQEKLAAYYEKFFDFGQYEKMAFFKKIQGWHRWQRVKKWTGGGKGRILDIGCGHGMFLTWPQREGWEALGIDYPSSATQSAKEHLHLKIIEADTETFLIKDSGGIGKFDFITLWHVLEHLQDPVSFLSQVAKLLKPSGKLWIAVPNAGCPGMQKRKEAWVWCQQPYVHTVHFSPKSLELAVQKAGLKTILTGSRDTWDANRLFDLYLMPGLTQPAFQNKIGISKINRGFKSNVENGLRAFCYLVSCFKHWALGLEAPPSAGSELFITAVLGSGKEFK